MLRNVISPIFESAIYRAIKGMFDRVTYGGAAFTPASLYGGSDKGAWANLYLTPEQKAFTVNRLSYSTDFNNAAWSKSNVTLSAGTESESVVVTSTAAFASIGMPIYEQSPSERTNSIEIRRVSGSGTVSINTAGNGYVPVSITSSWTRYSTTQTTSDSLHYFFIVITTSGDAIEIRKPQAEVGAAFVTYQPVPKTPEESFSAAFPDAHLFKDIYGAFPVISLGQPIGFTRSRSKATTFGSELITNGGFTDASWWNVGGVTISGGVCNYSAVVDNSGCYRLSLLTVGKYYEVTFTVVSCSSGGFFVGFMAGGSGNHMIRNTAGTYTVRLLAASTDFGILSAGGTTTGTIDNVSVKEVLCDYWQALSYTNRPLYSAISGGGEGAKWDGVDDCLTTPNLVAMSSSAECTVVVGTRHRNDIAAPSQNIYDFTTLTTAYGVSMLGSSDQPLVGWSTSTSSAVQLLDAMPPNKYIMASRYYAIATPNVNQNHYVNNSLVTATEVIPPTAAGTFPDLPLFIGCYSQSVSQVLDGEISDMVFINRGLTVPEIGQTSNFINVNLGAY